VVKQSHIRLTMNYIFIPMAYGSAFKRLSSYAFNGSIRTCGGAIKTLLMDSLLGV